MDGSIWEWQDSYTSIYISASIFSLVLLKHCLFFSSLSIIHISVSYCHDVTHLEVLPISWLQGKWIDLRNNLEWRDGYTTSTYISQYFSLVLLKCCHSFRFSQCKVNQCCHSKSGCTIGMYINQYFTVGFYLNVAPFFKKSFRLQVERNTKWNHSSFTIKLLHFFCVENGSYLL